MRLSAVCGFLPHFCIRISALVLAAASLALSLCPVVARAASPAVDNLISRLPNPDQWQKSPLETSLNNPEAKDPTLQALLKSAKRKDTAGALREVRKLSEQYPKSAAVHYLHGMITLATRQFFEAEGAFRRVVALQPDATAGWYELGITLSAQGRHADAIPPLRRVVEKLPRNPMVITQLGYCQLRAGRVAEATASCRQALRIKADFSPGWDVLGLCLRQGGKRGEALNAFQKATQVAPGNPIAWAHLSEMLHASGHHAEADAASTRAKELAAKLAKANRG